MLDNLLICISLAAMAAVSTVSAQLRPAFGAATPVTCSGGYPAGTVVRTDAYWYECSYAGKLEPKGCLSAADGRQLAIGESALSAAGDVEQRCVLDPTGFLKLQPTACVVAGGMRVPAGAEYDVNGAYWVKCHDKGYYLMRETMGCVVDGKRVRLQERVTRGQTVYQCQPGSNQDAVLSALACYANNQEHAIGQMFEDSEFFYHCSLGFDNTCSAKIIGCMHRNVRYYDRQIYKEGDQIYRCNIDPFTARGTHSLAGCVKHEPNGEAVEKTFGCQWEDGTAPRQYMVECVEQNGRAVKQRLRCKYTSPSGAVANLLNGCYTQVGGEFVGCARSQGGQLEIRTFPTSQEYLATQYGLVNDPYQCSIFTRRLARHR